MADDSVDAIDDKNNTEDTSSDDTANWSGFFGSVIVNFIIFLLLILIGSNFVFLVHFSSLDLIFPTDINKYLPNSAPGNKPQSAGGGCNKQNGGNRNFITFAQKLSTNKESFDLLKSLGYTNKLTGWPYSMYKKSAEEFSWQEVKNWFALTEANTYITYRKLMHIIYTGKYKDKELMKELPDPVLYLIGLIIPVFLTGLIVPVMTFITTIFFSFTSEKMGWVYTLLVFLLVLLLGSVNIILHQLSVMFNILVLPLIINYKTVFSIANHNSEWLKMVFGVFIIGSAFSNLDSTTAWVMTVAYLLLLIKKIFF